MRNRAAAADIVSCLTRGCLIRNGVLPALNGFLERAAAARLRLFAGGPLDIRYVRGPDLIAEGAAIRLQWEGAIQRGRYGDPYQQLGETSEPSTNDLVRPMRRGPFCSGMVGAHR